MCPEIQHSASIYHMRDSRQSGISPAFPAALALHSHPTFGVGMYDPISGGQGSLFLGHGCSKTRPARGGAEGAAHSRNIALGVSWREVISQPVFMCSDTTRARLFRLSSFPLSQCRVQCLLASPGCCRPTLPGKNSTTLCFCKRARAVPWHSHPGSLSLSWS